MKIYLAIKLLFDIIKCKKRRVATKKVEQHPSGPLFFLHLSQRTYHIKKVKTRETFLEVGDTLSHFMENSLLHDKMEAFLAIMYFSGFTNYFEFDPQKTEVSQINPF